MGGSGEGEPAETKGGAWKNGTEVVKIGGEPNLERKALGIGGLQEGVGDVDGAVAAVRSAIVDEPQGVGAVEDDVFPGDDVRTWDTDGGAEAGVPDDAIVSIAEARAKAQGGGPGDEGGIGGEEEGEGARGRDAKAVGGAEGENDEDGGRKEKSNENGEKTACGGIAEFGHGRGRLHTSRSMVGGGADVKGRIVGRRGAILGAGLARRGGRSPAHPQW